VLGFYKSLRSPVRRDPMDYIISGIAALFLFGYLVYALLRPERF
jgi:K+-transporting ATPase KdpF subunit